MTNTPAAAPWDWLAIGANASGGFHLYVTDANGRKIAAVWGGAEEKPATARLIIAAPELLSIAARWAALDGGAWNVQRHAAEKAELLADTKAIIARIET
jgi:hypothetical protein